MSWTARDQEVLNEIEQWRQTLGKVAGNDLTNVYSKWIERSFSLMPDDLKKEIFSHIDTSLFHIHSTMQGFQLQQDERESILRTAKAFDDSIFQIEDIRKLKIDQLNYLSLQQRGRHRLYSLLQGGIAGSGGTAAFISDLIALLIINIRAIQYTAAAYGRDVHTPYEMTIALKLFHASTLPRKFQGEAWDELLDTLNNVQSDYFFTGSDELTNERWLEGPGLQLFKTLAIRMFKNKRAGGYPVISMAIGAAANYQLTRNVTEYAERFYQYRYLVEKNS
ncbi:EcsC family protein [Jeotgalibacillus salarius]|uniref:EcsC family protein n=1 Tax=Jeotgalibacillus salarius TaxID=546023 RepID=A0A4Y8LIM0_9BACL|nr:EcsC family protein [Jeotgalibacillus salarius]TFE00922.1 EcsC family protein [Jeotgalibacillus salarius]